MFRSLLFALLLISGPLQAEPLQAIRFTPVANVHGYAGEVVGTYEAVGDQSEPIELSGPHSDLFTVDHGGMMPCHLIAKTDLVPGLTYDSITASAR